MSDIYSDDYPSVRGAGAPFLPPAFTRAAGAVVFLALVAGMAVWAYRLGTRDAAEVPIIRALEGPARVQPEDPGGLQAAHQGLEVNTVLGGAPAPAPAETAPRAAPPPITLAEEDGPQGELVLALPDIPVAPAEGEDLRMPLQDDGPGIDGLGIDGIRQAAEAPAADPASEVAAMIEAALEAEPAALAALDAEAEPAVEPGPRPRVRPANHVVRVRAPAPQTPAAPAPQATAQTQPAAQAQPAAPTAQAPSPPREVANLNPGTRLVQLGAFDNEALARRTWEQLNARHGDLLGAKSLFLERATHNARVFYRLRVAGFQNTDQTRVLCESLRARGVDCIPVTLN